MLQQVKAHLEDDLIDHYGEGSSFHLRIVGKKSKKERHVFNHSALDRFYQLFCVSIFFRIPFFLFVGLSSLANSIYLFSLYPMFDDSSLKT